MTTVQANVNKCSIHGALGHLGIDIHFIYLPATGSCPSSMMLGKDKPNGFGDCTPSHYPVVRRGRFGAFGVFILYIPFISLYIPEPRSFLEFPNHLIGKHLTHTPATAPTMHWSRCGATSGDPAATQGIMFLHVLTH